jgi:LEA14-like dessication related protein
MKPKIIILLAFAAAIILPSCTFDDVEVGKISGVNIISTSKEGIEIEVNIPVKNPNSMGFTISKVNIDLALNGVEFGKVSQAKSIRVKPKSDQVYPILFQIKFKESFQGLPKLLAAVMMGKKIDMKAEGYIKARKFVFSKKFTIDEKTPVNLFNKQK